MQETKEKKSMFETIRQYVDSDEDERFMSVDGNVDDDDDDKAREKKISWHILVAPREIC